jgi:outer membrane protein assembly factor BamB
MTVKQPRLMGWPRTLSSVSVSAFMGLTVLGLLSGCGSSSKPSPAPLESFTQSQVVSQVWTSRVASASQGTVSLVVKDGQVVAAGTDGLVISLDAATGQERWRAAAGAKLTAAVGSDGRYAAVVTDANELVVFDRGQPLWRDRLPGQVITAPLVAGERVFVQSVDRSVRAYDVLDGRWLWNFTRSSPEPLSLAQQSVLTAFRDTLVIGHGSRLLGLDPVRGTIRFEASLGQPRGTNEVERLSDLVGPAVRVDDDLCVRSFQLSVGCVDMNRGTVAWTRPQSGKQGVAGSDNLVVGADSADRLTAWRASNGEALWRVDRFQYRGLSTPVVWSGLVAFADNDAQLHFLSAQDGRTVARLSLDSPLAAAPVVADGRLYLQTRSGTLYALQAR